MNSPRKDVSFWTLVNIPGVFVPFLDAITRLIGKYQRFVWEDPSDINRSKFTNIWHANCCDYLG